jgi:hypothetical protein
MSKLRDSRDRVAYSAGEIIPCSTRVRLSDFRELIFDAGERRRKRSIAEAYASGGPEGAIGRCAPARKAAAESLKITRVEH